MLNYLAIEWIKIRKSGFLWPYVAALPCVTVLFTYLIASGLDGTTTTFNNRSGMDLWYSTLSLFFTISQPLHLILTGLLLIGWQQHEHRDNTFKLYEVASRDVFDAIGVRFILFFFIYVIVGSLSLFAGFKTIDLVLNARFLDSSFYVIDTDSLFLYFIDGYKALIVLSLPVYFFMFVLSFRIDKTSISILTLLSLCIVSFLSLPRWLFIGSTNEALKILWVMKMSDIPIYDAGDLKEVYIYNSIGIILLAGTMYYLAKQKRLLNQQLYE
ncbi:hypothetical protein BH09BAC3_BH09BAC3_38100 [soil metagenome]